MEIDESIINGILKEKMIKEREVESVQCVFKMGRVFLVIGICATLYYIIVSFFSK
jgi:hypothetical protein